MTTNEYFENMREQDKNGKTFPIGVLRAYWAWKNTVEYRAEMFEATEIPWGSELKNGAMTDFVNTLKEAGVKEFAVTDHSTALMEGIFQLVAAGCQVKAPTIVKRHPEHWGDEERYGLVFEIV